MPPLSHYPFPLYNAPIPFHLLLCILLLLLLCSLPSSSNPLLFGGVSAVDNEFQTPTFFSKVSFLAAAVFTGYWLSAIPPQFDYAMIHVSIHFFFISQRLVGLREGHKFFCLIFNTYNHPYYIVVLPLHVTKGS